MGTRRQQAWRSSWSPTADPDPAEAVYARAGCPDDERTREHAERLAMEDDVIHALAVNLRVWELYFNGICDAGDQAGA